MYHCAVSAGSRYGRPVRALAVALAAAGMLAAGGAAPARADLPAGAHTVRVGKIRMAYRESGRGTPLMLVNGSGTTLDLWDPALLEPLGAGRHVIVFDARGMGGSTDVPGNRLTVEQM